MNGFRCLFALLTFLPLAATTHAQEMTHVTLGPSTVPLYGPWKFTVGDSPIDPGTSEPLWAQPGFDDSHWETVDLTPKGLLDPLGGFSDYVKGWTARGHAGYSGYAWYRIRVQVAAQPGEKLALSGPPYVDDAYQLFSDVTLIGSFGKFTGRQPTFYFTQPMMCDLPAGGAQTPSSVRVIAFRLWMAPDTMVTQADTGGLHTAPLLGDARAVSAGYQLHWLEPIRGHIADLVEGLFYLLLAIVAFSLTRFDRSDPVYAWMGSIFVLLVINTILIVVAAWSHVLCEHGCSTLGLLVKDGMPRLRLGALTFVVSHRSPKARRMGHPRFAWRGEFLWLAITIAPSMKSVAPRRVESRQNNRIKELRAGLTRGGWSTHIAVEGLHLIDEAVKSGLRLLTVFVRDSNEGLLEQLALGDAEVLIVTEEVFASATTTEHPQGVAALVEAPQFAAQRIFDGVPLVVIAGGLQDPGNLGTLVRSAEAFGASGMILLPGTVSLWNAKTLRASSGSAFRLPVVALPAEDAFAALRAHGVQMLAAVARDGDSEVDLRGPTALLVGNEGSGLPDAWIAEADSRITIPLPGAVESLNAAIAGSVLLYEAMRQRKIDA